MLIGMPEAAKRMGLSSGDSARRALVRANVPLVRINARALAVDEADLARFMESRADYQGFGRPRKDGGAKGTTEAAGPAGVEVTP